MKFDQGSDIIAIVLPTFTSSPCNILRFFSCKFFFHHIFNIFVQNIDCGYPLEPPRRGGSYEYLQSMFWNENKKNRCTPVKYSFAIKNRGYEGVCFSWRCFPDGLVDLDTRSTVWDMEHEDIFMVFLSQYNIGIRHDFPFIYNR